MTKEEKELRACYHWTEWERKAKDLENKIADIKANCDLAIEGRDVEIKELKETDEYIIKTLERKVEKLQEDLRNKRISIKNKKVEIKTLGERCNQLLKDKGDLTDKVSNQAESLRITMLEEEKKGKRIEELEKENAELKEKLKHRNCLDCSNHDSNIKLLKAKGHIKTLLDCLKQDTNDPEINYYVCQYMEQAEQFLKEIEK